MHYNTTYIPLFFIKIVKEKLNSIQLHIFIIYILIFMIY